MNQLITFFGYGLFAGITGSLFGCVIGFLFVSFGRNRSGSRIRMEKNLLYSLLYEFSSGLMMAVVTFHLLPEAIDTGSLTVTLTGVGVGLVFLFLIGKLLRKHRKNTATGMLILLGIMLHNIPEGIAVGTALVNHYSLALSLLTVITIHDIPEGISAYIPLSLEGKSFFQIALYVFLCGLPTGVGAVFGGVFGALSPQLNAISLGIAAGAMLYILIFELSYEAKTRCHRKFIEIAYIFGLLLGIILK